MDCHRKKIACVRNPWLFSFIFFTLQEPCYYSGSHRYLCIIQMRNRRRLEIGSMLSSYAARDGAGSQEKGVWEIELRKASFVLLISHGLLRRYEVREVHHHLMNRDAVRIVKIHVWDDVLFLSISRESWTIGFYWPKESSFSPSLAKRVV
jgi:hypothetical protein